MNILEKIKKETVFFDGGTGSVLQSMGLKSSERPEYWNITHPDRIEKLHYDYYLAGADIVKSNTFGVNGLKYSLNEIERFTQLALGCAEKARIRASKETQKQKYIALDIGPLGKLLEPSGDLAFEDAVEAFAKTIRAGKDRTDLILIETMADTYEMKAAVVAAKENSSLPIFVTAAYELNAKLLTGGDPLAVITLLEGLNTDAIGMNCGMGPHEMLSIMQQYAKYSSLPIIVNPNAGLPHEENESTVYDIDEKEFADACVKLFKAGARILGGCCGTTPKHIKAMTEAISSLIPVPITEKEITVISSGTHAVEFSDKRIVIGERINPTGKPKLKAALRAGDTEYIIDTAISQRDAGAHALDVNVGLPDINEPEVMLNTIKLLQKTVDLPLQIDTSNQEAMECAARIYNGKPLLNSVNGKQESMDAVFPIAKKYGGVIIGLTLDENGIPSDSSGRIEIAKKILHEAEKYGISKKNIIFDPLTLAVSSDKNAAKVTLESVYKLKNELNVKTSLGVTNVSFGLPCRENLNAAFLTLALNSGLDAAIMNPNSENMMSALRSFEALTGLDDAFLDYIAGVTSAEHKEETPTSKLSLKQAIMNGLRSKASSIAMELIKSKAPIDIINEDIVPALDETGKNFELQKIFLPQLLMSAEAAGKAFHIVREEILKSDIHQSKKFKIILATVKGDIHDIGKNIVKTILESYNYDIIDLGRDVDARTIVDAAKNANASLVGLSALMTTTAPAMKTTIDLIKTELPECKVIVGGAVITEDYANKIGADAYAADAMSAVRYCERLSAKLS